jgi:general secretion pathway protein H
MRTWEAGNSSRGFTLLELLLVVTIIAMASAGVVFAMRDASSTQLEREAQRLAALLDAARALSRTNGVPVLWMPTSQGFRFDGLPPQALPTHWMNAQTMAQIPSPLVLGPEPIIGPQDIALRASDHPERVLHVRTDGLGPFEVHSEAVAAQP